MRLVVDAGEQQLPRQKGVGSKSYFVGLLLN